MDVHHRLPVRAALASCFYSAPQAPDDTRRLFEAALGSAGLDRDPLPETPEPRGPAIALALSREWKIRDLETRLGEAIDARFEPTWDRGRGEFTWGLRLTEEHPRGQYNAFLATAEAMSPGAWARLSEAPLEACPQVVGVDFPKVALRRARWRDGALELRLAVRQGGAQEADPRASTTFRITGAASGHRWVVTGAEGGAIEPDGDALVVTAPLRSGDLRVAPG